MANNVASLVVSLALNAVDYITGFDKAEARSKRFASSVQSDFSKIAQFIGGLAIGAAIIESTKAIIAEAAALHDLADATGSSVESLSKLNNQARISGSSFETLQGLMLKLAAGIGGVDDESNKVVNALKFLGVSSKDPAEALNQVALRLNQFADGAGKAAIARDLFGKGGPAFLSVLKDIAETQDVAATTSKKQAEEANNLEKAFRRLSVEATGFRNALLNDVVPGLTELLISFADARKASDGFIDSLRALANAKAGLFWETEEEAVKRLRGELEKLEKVKAEITATGSFKFFGMNFGAGLDNTNANIANITKALVVAEAALQRTGRVGFQTASRMNADRAALPKPELNFAGTPDAKKIKEAVSEAQRYLDALTRQAEKLAELTVEEQLLADVQKGRLKGLTPAIFEQALALAQIIDAEKKLTKELEAGAKAFEEEARAAEAASKAQADATKHALDSADQVLKSNEQLRDEIAIILGGDAARKALEKDYVNRAIAVKEALAAELALTKGTELQVDAINIEIEALKERAELLKGRDFAEALAAEAKNLQDVKNAMSDALVQPLADFVTGTKSAKDAFKSFVADVTQQLARLASQNVANALFGGKNSSGPDFFAVMTKFLGLFGGGTGVGGFEGSAGFGAGEGFALGGVSRGGIATVGEHGAEEVFLPKGARVISHAEVQNRRQAKAVTNIFNVNVMPGANTQSVMQTKAMLRDAVMQSARER